MTVLHFGIKSILQEPDNNEISNEISNLKTESVLIFYISRIFSEFLIRSLHGKLRFHKKIASLAKFNYGAVFFITLLF